MELILHTYRIKQARKVSLIYKMQCSEDHAEPFLQEGVKHPWLGCTWNRAQCITTSDMQDYFIL